MRTKEQSEKVAHSCREILALYERWGNPDPEHVRIVTEKLREAERDRYTSIYFQLKGGATVAMD